MIFCKLCYFERFLLEIMNVEMYGLLSLIFCIFGYVIKKFYFVEK